MQLDHSPPRGVDAVQDGGFLDLRSIYMIRGGGYDLDDGAASHIIHALSSRLVLAKMCRCCSYRSSEPFPARYRYTCIDVPRSTGLLADLGHKLARLLSDVATPFRLSPAHALSSCASTLISYPIRSHGPAHGELRPRAAGGAIRRLWVRSTFLLSLALVSPMLFEGRLPSVCPSYPPSKDLTIERAHVLIRWPAATHCLSPPSPCSAVFRNVPRGPAFTLEQLSLGPRKRQRNFGGHVLVIAGSFYCFGCRPDTFIA